MSGLFDGRRGASGGRGIPSDEPNPSPSADRYDLQDRYLDLVRVQLPHAAKTRCGGVWCVEEDHCFMRIVLDHVFEDCWYAHKDRRLVGYKQLSTAQLERAVSIANAILAGGREEAHIHNERSLAWRRACRNRRQEDPRSRDDASP